MLCSQINAFTAEVSSSPRRKISSFCSEERPERGRSICHRQPSWKAAEWLLRPSLMPPSQYPNLSEFSCNSLRRQKNGQRGSSALALQTFLPRLDCQTTKTPRAVSVRAQFPLSRHSWPKPSQTHLSRLPQQSGTFHTTAQLITYHSGLQPAMDTLPVTLLLQLPKLKNK